MHVRKRAKPNTSEPEAKPTASHHDVKQPSKRSRGQKSASKFDELLQEESTAVSIAKSTCMHVCMLVQLDQWLNLTSDYTMCQ